MNHNVLAQNVRRIRTVKGMSQASLAAKAGISTPSVKNLETGKGEPRMATVEAMAGAMNVPLRELFAPVRPLGTVRFRSSRRMQHRENILADIARRLDDFSSLESALGERVPFVLDAVRGRCHGDNPAGAAALCRKQLRLSESEPVHDICGLLESAGVKVLPIPAASDGFFGLSVGEEDGGPAVAVNVWDRITVERRIFSAAHELGHLMLHRSAYDVSQTGENKDEEREADQFAGHFLMPEKGFLKEWGDAAGLYWVDRVFKVKRIFHVSYKTVLARLVERGEADGTIWMQFNLAYQRRFHRKLTLKEEPADSGHAEPFGLQPFDFYEDRFSRLVRRAVEEEKISVSRGAEMLRISVGDMRELLSGWGAFS